jgi:hypothetical protein
MRASWALLVIAVLTMFPLAVRADVFDREAYERDLIDRSLAPGKLTVEPEPQGKIIERIEVVRQPIIEASDPWPDFLNIFHVTTREHIVRQELLFEEGDRYSEELVRESARNLRGLPLLFSTVRIVTARGSAPDKIVVVVITKDLWSLRMNSQFSFGGGVFNYLSLKPTEQNFLGYNQQLSLYTYIDRDTYSIGEVYNVPRLFGSRFTFFESLHLRLNHTNGEEEGGFGSLGFGLPLYAVGSKWGFSVGGSFDIGTRRHYQGADLYQVGVEFDDNVYLLDWMWNYRSFTAQAQVVRSFGTRWKTNLLFGYTLRSRTYDLHPDFPDVPFEVRQYFTDSILPRKDQAGEILAKLVFYEATYHRFQNIQTYGLTEDYRFGPQVILEAAWANPAFGLGFDQHSFRFEAFLSYRLLLGGKDILSVSADISARYWPDHGLTTANDADTGWVDRRAELYAENVSPVILGLGRFLVRFKYVYSQYSITNSLLSLGGDNTLRGYVSGYRSGERLLNVNVEFRSVPIVLWTLHWGVVVFYDGGDAFGYSTEDDFDYHQSLGLGIRGLFPQFDRGVVRLDFGIPLGKDFHINVIDWVTISYLQAF